MGPWVKGRVSHRPDRKYKGNKEFFQDVVVVRPMMLSTIVVAMAK